MSPSALTSTKLKARCSCSRLNTAALPPKDDAEKAAAAEKERAAAGAAPGDEDEAEDAAEGASALGRRRPREFDRGITDRQFY
jgi:hypothetical protein